MDSSPVLDSREDGLSILNHPAARLPGPCLLHQLVKRSSENVAIDYDSPAGRRTRLSYDELHEASDRLAARISSHLPKQNHQSGFIVPVLLHQGPGLYVALLAILKAGGAFCPLNLDAPSERVKFILKDVAAVIVITSRELESRIPRDGSDAAVLLLDGPAGVQGDVYPLAKSIMPTDLAYVMYTSGSTGTPKGVGISHDAATQSLLAHDKHIPAFSRFLQFAAPTFDVSVFEIFFPLFRGCTLVSCSRGEMLNDLPAILRRMEVDACELTPTVAGSLLRKREYAPGLRLLLTIGEMLTGPVVEEFGGNEKQESILWAMYGPTEAAIHCTLQPAFPGSSPIGNIGIPLDTVSAFIVAIPEDDAPRIKDSLEILSRGQIGELAVGGYQLADGYLNRLEQTASSFIHTPYGRLYRTGDKARLLADGTLECLGRISDGQVKLRGQRIELGEVEHAALRTPGCHATFASVLSGILVLFCAVDLVDGMEEQIQQSCSAWLPAFMKPGDIVVIPEFPRLPSGKIDRNKLKQDYNAARKGQVDASHARDQLEHQLIKLTSQVLGHEVGSTTLLSAEGMESLSAIRLASLLRQNGVDVTAMEVLTSRTISDLYSGIQEQQNAQKISESGGTQEEEFNQTMDASQLFQEVPLLTGQEGMVEAILPCTPLQASMLLETSTNPQAYCNWTELNIPSSVTIDAIRNYFQRLAAGNDILRSGFTITSSGFVQIVWRNLHESQIREVSVLSNGSHTDIEEFLLRPFSVEIQSEINGAGRQIMLRMHHAIYDGWSLDALLSDLASLIKGDEPPHRQSFREVIQFYRSRAYFETNFKAKEFWAQHLLGFQITSFPGLLPSLSDQHTTASSSIGINLYPGDVKNLLHAIESVPSALFQATLAWLWSSILGNEDVVIGTVTSGRTIPVAEIEAIIGPCISTVPHRTNLAHMKTIRDLITGIHTTNRALLSHSSLPLAEIKQTAGVPLGEAIYDVVFIYQESLYSGNEQQNIVHEVAHQDFLESKLLVEVSPQPTGFNVRATYHTDALSEPFVEVLLSQFVSILEHFVSDVDLPLSSVRKSFGHNLLSVHNPNPWTLDSIADIASVVEATVDAYPERPALVFAKSVSNGSVISEQLTFDQLNRLANRIAHALRKSGTSVGRPVGIIMEKSLLLYAGILGILKAGCAYLPLLPATPRARVDLIVEQSGLQFCLTDSASKLGLHGLQVKKLINLESTDLSTFPDTNLMIPAEPMRVANIIYTSGSTGVPKGVCVTQLNIASNLEVLSQTYPIQSGSRLLQSCSQAFDVSVFEIFFSWKTGMCLCAASNDTLFEDLEHAIRVLEITHLSMTPTVAALVDPKNVPRVVFLVTSGEPMTETVANKWSKQLYQGYGPSETTNICTVKKMAHGDIIRHLGWSFENTSTIVLDAKGSDIAPLGSVGELCFGGDQVTAGYLNMPELTATKFICHPLYGRLYRSGDLGRMLPDESLIIIGRVDDQIKLRGQRIELNEINEIVKKSTKAECVTCLVEGVNNGSDRLVTFFVDSSEAVDSSHIQGFTLHTISRQAINNLFHAIQSRVPSYMVPANIIPISRIPLTPSGKVDKNLLKAVFRDLSVDHLEDTSSAEDIQQDNDQLSSDEAAIAGIISDTLGIERLKVRRWTPLTSYGLDSITAVAIAQRLRKSLNKPIAVSEVLRSQCVARLAEVLANTLGPSSLKSTGDSLLPEELVHMVTSKLNSIQTVGEILPCTPLQEAMLAASDGTSQSYLNSMLFRIQTDPDVLQQAWIAMCKRHGILRTCFLTTEDQRYPIIQVVLQDWSPAWNTITSSHTLDEAVQKHIASLSGPLNTFIPPISFGIISHKRDHYFSFLCHHALYDGMAVERLLFEVEQSCRGTALDPPPSYAQFLQETLRLPESTEKFWSSSFAKFKPIRFPREKTTPGLSAYGTSARQLAMSFSRTNDQLRALGFSLLSTCQAAWAAVLSIMLKSEDVCFGNVVSGRSVAIDRIEELVAPCFNTLPVRVDLAKYSQNRDLLISLNELGMSVLQYQFTPLRRIRNLAGSEEHLFDTLLLLQQPSRPLDREIWELQHDQGEMDVRLVCEILPETHTDALTVKLHYDRGYLSETLSEVIINAFCTAFETTLNFPAARLFSHDSGESTLFRSSLGQFELHYSEESTLNGKTVNGSSNQWTLIESAVRTTFSRLSSVAEKDIRRGTTIYQLGLDSISAVQIASMLRNDGYSVTASDVVENRTCESLAAFLAEKSSQQLSSDNSEEYNLEDFQETARSHISISGIAEDVVENIFPCTPLQVGMLIQYLDSGGSDYFNYQGLRFDQSIEIADLLRALKVLISSSPTLRTGFVPVDHADSSFAMVEYRALDAPFPVTVQVQEIHHEFNASQWHRLLAQTSAKELTMPPWAAMLIGGEKGVTMHLGIHHALYDAYSLKLLMNSLAAILQGFTPQVQPSLEGAVKDVMSQVKNKEETSQEFWVKQASKTVINRFPLLTPLAEHDRHILCETFTSATEFSLLETAAKKHGFTVQAAAQAAWARILSSYLGEQTVAFGVVFSGRNTDATNDTLLPCISTLPVIAQNVSQNSSMMKNMLALNVQLFKHQHTPLSAVQKWLGYPDRRLFDTLLVYQKFEGVGEGQLPWRVLDDRATIDYPVSIEIRPQGVDKLAYSLTFYSDVIPLEQARLILRQFDAMLWHLASRPDDNEEDLARTACDLFSVTPPKVPDMASDEKLLHQFVESQALKNPEKIALEFVDSYRNQQVTSRKWTYRDLDAFGNRVAHLIGKYVELGDIVAIHFDKCPEAFFAILGILKAGCSFLALDPAAPALRKEFVVNDSAAKILLVSSREGPGLDFQTQVPIVAINETSLQNQPSGAVNISGHLRADSTCYCLYTSGTTGTPKGCEITHENAVQAMLAFQHLFAGRWTHESRWLQFASLHFDVSVLEQYWSWSVGITLVAAPRDLILEDLAGTISGLGITHIDLTPSLARLIHPRDTPSLCKGIFITGGEQLKQEILDVWGDEKVIYNAYGPTEATIGVTTFPQVPRNGRASNIGRQFLNVGSYVLKPGSEIPVLRGGVGELCVSGKLVGKGYLNREDLTAERFPTLARFAERVYRTGDLVRILHDGCFEFLGRADDQVKLRGQRLEIGEINHTIRKGVPELSEVVTLVVRNEKQQKDLLVSFIVRGESSRAGGTPHIIIAHDTTELALRVQDACRARLPGYMVPTYVLQVPFIPLSSNNKAEVKKLKQLFADLSQEQLLAASAASGGPNGDILSSTGSQIIEALTSINPTQTGDISTSSNLFELGIDSISVVRFVRALKRAGLAHASPSLILSHPFIGDLSRALDSRSLPKSTGTVSAARQIVHACHHRHLTRVSKALNVKSEELDYIAPCTALQQGIISRSKNSEANGAYFNTFCLELSPNAEISRLLHAWEKVFQQCAILRTKFVETPDGHIQVALKTPGLPIKNHGMQLSDQVENVVKKSREDWLRRNESEICEPFHLLLLDGDQRPRVLVLHIFHALYDANSLQLLLERVMDEYHDAPTVNYGPSFLEAILWGPLQNHTALKQFWVNRLEGAQLTKLPALAKTAQLTVSTASRKISFSSLEAIRTRLNVTHQAIVQALWVSILARYLGDKLTIGIVTSGRAIDVEDIELVIGPLFNTLPFYIRDISRQTWSSLVRKCHEFTVGTLHAQHTPLRDIQKWCSGGKPLFDTLFSFQREAEQSPYMGRNTLWTERGSDPSPDYPLALEATLKPNAQLDLLIVAQAGVADAESLSKLLDDFEEAAALLSQEPNSPVEPGASGNTVKAIPFGYSEGPGSSTREISLNSDFAWTEELELIREEIARLAEVSVGSVTEATTLLELGLDSIDSIKLSTRLRERGVMVRSGDLLRYGNIYGVSKMLQQQTSNQHTTTSVAGGNTTKLQRQMNNYVAESSYAGDQFEFVLPPTPLQDSMIAEMLQSDFGTYFNHDVLEIAKDVDVGLLKGAWQTVVDASPILRTIFAEVDNPTVDFAYVQLVQRNLPLSFGETELASLEKISEVFNQATQRAISGRGLSELIQLTFVTVSTKKFLVLSIAHALYDGWSIGLLHQDVELAYRGLFHPRPKYDSYLYEMLGLAEEESKAFWSGYLDGSRSTHVPPTRRPEGPTNIVRSETASFVSSTRLREFCKKQAVSPQVVGQACWAAFLATKFRSLDVIFGLVLSGRDSDVAEELMFPTMNTVPLRVVMHGTVTNWLQYLQENMNNVRQHQQFPLRKSQKLVGGRTGPLFNTLFMQQREQSPGSSLMSSVASTSAIEYPLSIEMELSQGGLIWRVGCADDYFSANETRMLLSELDNILAFLLQPPDADVLTFEGNRISVCGQPSVEFAMDDSSEDNTDRRAVDSQDEEDTSWSDTEAAIRQVLSEVSGTSPSDIRKSHNIYHLGLDSISSIKASTLLRRAGVALSVRQLLAASSISEMAALTSEPKPLLVAPEISTLGEWNEDYWREFLKHNEIEIDSLASVLPATPIQVHTLSVWQNTQGHVFFPSFYYRLNGDITLEQLANAWDELVKISPILRTSFVATGSVEVPFLELNFMHKPQVAARSPLRPAGEPSILLADPASRGQQLAHLTVWTESPSKWLLKFKIHHALYDGVSLPAMIRSFLQLCSQRATLQRDTSQDVSIWRSSTVRGSNEERRKFWEAYLHGAASNWVKGLKADGLSARVSSYKQAAIPDVSTLRSLAAQHGVTIQALFLAAYAGVLANQFDKEKRHSEHDVVFGVYLANRNFDDNVANLPYPTLSIVPLRVKVSESLRLVKMARQVQDDLARISTAINSSVGLWEIKEWTGLVLDSFVNFLSLSEQRLEDHESTSISIEPLEATMGESMDRFRDLHLELGDTQAIQHPWLDKNAVKSAYPDAVDIEAKISGDALDIGVFGSTASLGSTGAARVIDSIVGALQSES